MNGTLTKALLVLVPTSLLFAFSTVLLRRERSTGSLLQVVGMGCLLIVVLTHVFEGLHLFRSMGWGRERSIGHYLDFWSAVLGLVLVPAGHLLRRLQRARAQ